MVACSALRVSGQGGYGVSGWPSLPCLPGCEAFPRTGGAGEAWAAVGEGHAGDPAEARWGVHAGQTCAAHGASGRHVVGPGSAGELGSAFCGVGRQRNTWWAS